VPFRGGSLLWDLMNKMERKKKSLFTFDDLDLVGMNLSSFVRVFEPTVKT
jgi:hypothetical protein